MSGLTTTFSLDDRRVQRGLDRVRRSSERTARDVDSAWKRVEGPVKLMGTMLTLEKVIGVGKRLWSSYAKENEKAQEVSKRFRAAIDPLISGVGDDLVRALESVLTPLDRYVRKVESAREATVNFLVGPKGNRIDALESIDVEMRAEAHRRETFNAEQLNAEIRAAEIAGEQLTAARLRAEQTYQNKKKAIVGKVQAGKLDRQQGDTLLKAEARNRDKAIRKAEAEDRHRHYLTPEEDVIVRDPVTGRQMRKGEYDKHKRQRDQIEHDEKRAAALKKVGDNASRDAIELAQAKGERKKADLMRLQLRLAERIAGINADDMLTSREKAAAIAAENKHFAELAEITKSRADSEHDSKSYRTIPVGLSLGASARVGLLAPGGTPGQTSKADKQLAESKKQTEESKKGNKTLDRIASAVEKGGVPTYQ